MSWGDNVGGCIEVGGIATIWVDEFMDVGVSVRIDNVRVGIGVAIIPEVVGGLAVGRLVDVSIGTSGCVSDGVRQFCEHAPTATATTNHPMTVDLFITYWYLII